MKYSNIIGLAAGVLLIISCFLPWTFHPDLQEYFTGFYSRENYYGKPGKFFLMLTIPAITFFILPRIWAKRANLMVVGLIVAYAAKNLIVFTSCYNGICPVKQVGIYLMLFSVSIMMVAVVSPAMKLKSKAPQS